MSIKNLIALAGILVLILSACGDTTSDIPANQKRGNQLIQAINEYTEKFGQFPESLDVLAPEFIAELPTTVGGRDFEYFKLNYEYILGFDVTNKANYSCGYSSRYEDWECSFGAE